MPNKDRAGRDEIDDSGQDRVVPLRRRGAPPARSARHAGYREPLPPDPQGEDRDDTDDYRRRMLANAVGLVLIAGLIAAGIWLADAIAAMRKQQDCVLSGRRNCAPIAMPESAR